jgi:hypothetical protein
MLNIETKRSETTNQSTRPELFFHELKQSFYQAKKAVGGTIDRYYQLGEKIIQLRFAGPALISKLTPALSHLETQPHSQPDLTINLWDSASTGVQPPPPPWEPDDYLQFGQIRGYNNKRIKTVFMIALQMIDLELNEAVYWIPDTDDIPYYHSIRPLRSIINWWMNKFQHYIVHSAAVGLPEAGVLITGRGGAGKSTTTLSCIGSGIKLAGDENCLISLKPKPHLHSLYCSGSLDSKDAYNIPGITPYLYNASRLDREKAVYLFTPGHQEIMVKGFPIKAILIPRITGNKETTITESQNNLSLISLAPESIFQLPGAGAKHLQIMADLIRQVPCFSLELGSQIERIPVVIEKFLRSWL